MMNRKSFTLVEIILVVAIFGILIGLSLPFTLKFYQVQQLDSTFQSIVQTIRRAQFQAMANEFDSDFGFYFSADQYFLFRGPSYIARTDEESFDLPKEITRAGLWEIVFKKLTGLPNTAGYISISSAGLTRIISINQLGRINYEK